MHKLEESRHEIDVFEALLERSNPSITWGVTLGGDGTYRNPLHIAQVTPGSPAARIGLKSGDVVTEIGDTSTQGITHQAAQDIIRQFGLSLILTVERKAHGAIPVNPVVTPHHDDRPTLKAYQTYDMSGAASAPRPAPTSYDFKSVSGRPYEAPPGGRVPINASSHVTEAHPAHNYDHVPAHVPAQPTYQPTYVPQSEDYTDSAPGDQAQSRTFKILQGLMANDEPVPPPVHLNTRPDSQAKADIYTTPRGSQMQNRQFNTPIGMYSSDTISDTLVAHMDSVDISGQPKSQQPTFSSGPDKPVLKSDVLQMVRQMDEEKKGGIVPGRPSERTGKSPGGTPWMKKSTGSVRSPYNIYKQMEAEERAAQRDVSDGGTYEARTPESSSQIPKQPAATKEATPGSGTRPAGITSSRAGVHGPMGYKPFSSPYSNTTNTPQAPVSVVESKPFHVETPAPVPVVESKPFHVDASPALPASQPPAPVSTFAPGADASTDKSQSLDTPVRGFRSVSPVFNTNSTQSGSAPSSVDRNFNIKPRPFGFTPTAPSHVEPPVAASHQHRSIKAPAVTGERAVDTGPGYSEGSNVSKASPWQESGLDTQPQPEGDLASYSGTEAHGTDSSSYDLDYNDQEEPYAGSAGLPPPRSASMDRWRQEQEAKRKGSPRVKVFMPQQYNSPIGMYSAGNVIDTFQTQAEIRMQDMERPQDKIMSEAQRAVLEEDAGRR